MISNNQNKANISSEFLDSIQKILPLFRCFYEVDDKSWCDAIVNCSFLYYEGKSSLCLYRNSITITTEVEDMSLLLAYRQEWFRFRLVKVTAPKVFLKIFHQALVVHSTLHTPVINTIILYGIVPPLEVSQAHYIVEMVISCKTKVLNVSDNHLHSIEWIIQMLSHKSCMIEELDISDNSITSTTACELLAFIKSNKSLRLRSLDLHNNPINDTIANELAVCIMLEEVSLSFYYGSYILTSVTAIKLFSCINISKHSRLKSVDIRGDFTDDQVAYEIAICFQHNCILTHLSMSTIKVSDEACLQMINALEYNTTLQRLWLRLECSECLVSKINSRIAIINGKRHMTKFGCDDTYHKGHSKIYIELINTN